MHYELVIFDCDGTLVDSETLYNTVTSELLNEIGFAEYTPQLCLALFAGMAWSDIRATLEAKHKTKMPDNIIQRYIGISNTRMDTELKAPPHIHDVLDTIKDQIKICVGSNGERNNVLKSLRITGLGSYFPEGIVFTKIQVAKAKPAPDLFLFAAEKMSTAPEKCLVIEDSVAGIQAARAAGMDALGFTGTAHDKNSQKSLLDKAGAHKIIDSLIHIPDVVKHGKDWLK